MVAFAARDFPKAVGLRDGATVTVRPLASTDTVKLWDFFSALPEPDRYFMKDDVLDPATTARWTSNIDHDRALALVAVSDDAIVADGVLLKQADPARRHLAEVRVNITPGFQGKGLGTVLIRELAEIAWEADVEVLGFELVEGVQDAAIEAVRGLGAFHVGTLQGYLRDPNGEPRSLVLYQIPLGSWFKF